ncbi:MAG: hypothetical protein M1151_06315 [Candidatus Thermoplasmatota archaeon]|nr:hypothetical protein [Candidatus Thermoplasmatota archaeon]
MVRVAIIALIALITLVPSQMSGSENYGSYHWVPQFGGQETYNFSALPSGSFPGNLSWINMSVEGRQYMNATIGRGAGSVGLDLRDNTMNYAGWVWTNLTVQGNSSVNIVFSWNDNLSYSLSEPDIGTFLGPGQGGNLSFGSPDGYDARLTDQSGYFNLGPQPAYNVKTSIRFFLPPLDQAPMMFSVSNGSSGDFPQIMNLTDRFNGNLDLRWGGMFTNMTIYSITMEKGIAAYLPVNESVPEYRRVQDASLGSGSFQRYGFLPVSRINGVLYAEPGAGLGILNYYNGSVSTVIPAEPGFNVSDSWISRSGNCLFATMASTTGILLYNLSLSNTSFACASLMVSDTSSVTVFRNPSGAAILDGANLTWFSIQGSSINREWSLSLFPGAGTKILYAHLGAGKFTATMLENGSMYSAEVNISTGDPGTSLLGSSDLVSEAYPPEFYNDTVRSAWRTVTGTVVIFNGTMEEFAIPGTPQITAVAGSNEGFTVTTAKGILVGNGTRIILDTGEVSGTAVPLGNGSFVDVVPGYCILAGTAFPFSPDTISLGKTSPVTIHGNATIGIGVSSALPYEVRLNLSGKEFLSNGDTIAIDPQGIPDGTYLASVTAENEAGYVARGNITVYVDVSGPGIGVTPSNSSYVPDDFALSVNGTSIFGISRINVTSANLTWEFNGTGATVPFSLNNYTGPLHVSILVSDSLGFSREVNVTYNAISANAAGFRASIRNGSYLNRTHQNMTWTPISGISRYEIVVRSASGSIYYYTATNRTTMILPEGHSNIGIYCDFLDGVEERVSNLSVTVISYRPGLTITRTTDSAFSFFGNSANDTFTMTAASNMTAYIGVSISSPSGQNVMELSNRNTTTISIGPGTAGFSISGNYSVKVVALSLSGTENVSAFAILVNNTVPQCPFKPQSIYSRTGNGSIPGQPVPGLRYLVTVAGPGEIQQIQSYTNWINESAQGEYQINVTGISDSGNFNSTNLTFFYYNLTPQLTVSYPGIMINSSSLEIAFSVIDPSPMRNVSVTCGTLGLDDNLSLTRGQFLIQFPTNGNYILNFTAEDKCGNAVSRNLSESVRYFINVTSSSIESAVFGTSGTFRVVLNGNIGHTPNVSWYVNGKFAGNGITTSNNLNYGQNEVAAVISYNGRQITDSSGVYCVGFVPEIVTVIAASAYWVYRRATVNKDESALSDMLKEMNGASLRQIFREGKKHRFSRAKINEKINGALATGRWHISTDISGKEYLMPSELPGTGSEIPRPIGGRK